VTWINFINVVSNVAWNILKIDLLSINEMKCLCGCVKCYEKEIKCEIE
jgi:hypothetical protein